MRRRVRLAAGLGVLAVLGGCTGGPTAGAGKPTPADTDDVLAVETELPPCPDQPPDPAVPTDLPAISLDCIGGGSLDLARSPGLPTVLNLWASWCGPCRDELPIFEQLAATAGDELRVIGVASQDGVPQAASFADDSGLGFATAFDGEGAVAAGLGLKGLPHSVFVAADGSVAHVEVGAVQSIEELRGLVAQHLGVQL